MRLTQYTDYSLRVLLYLGVRDNNKLSNIKEIAEAYNISKPSYENHSRTWKTWLN